MTTTSFTIIIAVIAAILCFFIYLEFKLKDNGSHLELVEIAPLTEKNIEKSLRQIGATDIRLAEDSIYTFKYEDAQ